MIQFFRQNNFLTAFMLIPYTFLVRMAGFFFMEGPEPMSTAGVLYNVFASSFENHIILSHITINLVIAFSAILVNRVVIVHRLSRFQSLLPGLIYILLVSWIESFLAFTAIHIANFFILIGILSLFKFSKKTTSGIVVFDALFYFGLAALFYTPYLIYIVISILGLLSLNRFRFRDLVNAIAGFCVPFFIVGGLLYYGAGTFSLFEGYEINTNVISWFIELELQDLIPMILYLTLVLICLLSYGVLTKANNLTVLKKIDLLFWFLAFSALTTLFINERNVAHLIILSLPAAIILGMAVERLKAPAIEEFAHLVILGAVFFIHFSDSVNILM